MPNVSRTQSKKEKNIWIFKKLLHFKWVYSYTRKAPFSHKNISCGVAIGFYRSKTIEQTNEISDK